MKTILLPVLVLSSVLSPSASMSGVEDAVPGRSLRVPIEAIGQVRIVASPGRRPVFSEDRIRKLLRRFVGGEWDPREIGRRLESRYRVLGYLPVVDIAVPGGLLDVRIRESRFRLEVITRDPADLARIGVERRGGAPPPPSGRRDIPDWILYQNLLAVPGDYDNLARYTQERFRMARFGYDIAFIPGAPQPESGFDAAAYLLVPRGQGGRVGAADEDRLPPDKNYIGGSASYGPRRGAAVQVVYRRWRWLTPFDIFEVSPDYSDELGGEISYRTDYLFPETIARRNVSLALRLFSEFTPNRVIGGQETDERNEGGRAFFGVELLPEAKPHDLEVGFELERSRLELAESSLVPAIEDFAFLRLTSRYTYRHLYRPPRFQLRVLPALILSLDALGGEVSYELLSLDADLHHYAFNRVQLDFHFIGGTMSGEVPLTQELRLGGANTVRGFEAEDFAGTRMIALQSELWFPLSPGRPGGGRFLSRLMGAVFLDAGTIDGGRQGPAGDPVGTGLGLRYTLSGRPLFVKLDYGFAIHDGDDDHFYMSLGFLY